MAFPGNPNQPGGGPFDMNKFVKPTTPTTNTVPTANPNPSNVNSFPFPPPSYPLLPSASYPPPTAGPQSYLPQISGFLPSQFHHQVPPHPQQHQQHQHQDNQFINFHHQRSMPYPAPSLPPPTPHQFQLPQNSSPTPNHGARLMALLSAPPSTFEVPPQQQQATMPMSIPPTIQPSSSGGSDQFIPHNVPIFPSRTSINQGMISHSSPMRMLSSKLPRGRHLIDNNLLYDIDVRLPGEVQPQLEVTPITKYGSDPGLVLGRQIAVNKTYICYGLKLGAIRVLNINTALRSLFKGLSQRVTDMTFFAEDVHLLASASTDGQVYVWKITEGPDDEEKPQITGKIIIAIHIVGAGESVHPRVCWHCHKQEILVVGIGRHVLKIDTTKVGRSEMQSAEKPIICPVDDLIDGVQLVGTHDGEVTDLSMSQWMATRLASASADGTVKIWEGRELLPIAVLRPHDGQPVNSVRFLTSPRRPDHIILITGGSLNREVKIWASESEEGWLLPDDTDSWQCTQVLELKSSAEARVEEAFFNQIVASSQAGLLLIANAKKNAIYVIHLEYGPNPAATRMDYIVEFTVTMPVLSFTGTSDILPQGEQILQVYCVQTQAIQQYSLEVSQCLPPPMENVVLDRSDSSVSCDAAKTDGRSTLQTCGNKMTEMSLPPTASKTPGHKTSSKSAFAATHVSSVLSNTNPSEEFGTSSMDSRAVSLPLINSNSGMACGPSPPLPLSPKLSRKINPSNRFEPGLPFVDHGGDHKSIEYSIEQQLETVHMNLSNVPSLNDDLRSDENKIMQDDISAGHNHPVKFKHPMHLITPSEILMNNSASEINNVIENKSEEQNFQDVVINNDTHNIEVDVKVVGETGFSPNNEPGFPVEVHNFVSESKEKSFYSQASDIGIQMARDGRAFSTSYIIEEAKEVNNACGSETVAQPSSTKEEAHDSTKVVSGKVVDYSTPATGAQQSVPSGKVKRQKGKNNQGSDPSSHSPSAFNSTACSAEPGISSSISSAEAVFSQIHAMQETLNQLVSVQKEIHKQMTAMVDVPVTKECRRVEASIGRSMEKIIKANVDALLARFQEETAKHEKLVQDRTQQLITLITNCMSKDLPAAVEKFMKKELAAIGPAVAQTIFPTIEKTVSTAIVEVFQKGVGDKGMNQLEKSVNSKLEATVARQIQAQFQTSGKQALQEALKFTLEASVVPSFEVSCKAMFEQIDATFHRGIVEHTAASQKQFESMHSPLTLALRDAINSASSMTQTLSGELADGQRKLLALAIARTSPKGVNKLISQLSNGPLTELHEKIEAPFDPTKVISRMISERKFEEAFTLALQRSEVSIVSWLCSQVDLQGMLSMSPLPLSQGVLLSLLQQLSCDITNDTLRKLSWMTDVVVAINPADPRISVHVRPIFDQVYQILSHHRGLPSTSNAELSSIRVVLHIINSMLMTSK